MLEARLADPFTDYLEGSNLSLSLADARVPDMKLSLVNDAFCKLTGYSRGEALGRNCRFLQPKGGAGPVTARMRHFLRDKTSKEARFLIPNETKDGRPFVNLVYMTKLYVGDRLDYVLGAQFDATHLGPDEASLYERSLREDVSRLSALSGESGHIFLGTFTVLANSAALIAQSKLSR